MKIVVVVWLRRVLPPETKVAPLESEVPKAISAEYSWEPYNSAAIGVALRLKDLSADATLVALGIGPQGDRPWRELLALGADRVIHLKVSPFDEADCLHIADILEEALKEIGFDCLLVTAPDDEPPVPHAVDHLLSHLKLPVINNAHTVMFSPSRRVIEAVHGAHDARTSAELPCALIVQTGSMRQPFATLKSISKAKGKPVEVVLCDISDRDPTQPGCQVGSCRLATEEVIEGSLCSLVDRRQIWPSSMQTHYVPLSQMEPVAKQLKAKGFELDQRLYKTIRRCAECARYVEDEVASSSPQSDDDPLWSIWDWNPDPLGRLFSPIVVNPKMEGICDVNIAAYLLTQESSILEAMANAAKSAYHRKLITESIRETGNFLHCLNYDGGDAIETMCCATPTTRVFNRAWFQARARGDRTVTWLDFLDATLELSTALYNAPDVRPLFADYLVEKLTGPFVKERMDDGETTAFLSLSRAKLPRFDGDFQYVLELDKDTPVLRISSYVGDFVQMLPDRRCVECRGLLLHGDDHYWDFTADAIAELNELLANVKTRERQFQFFFEKHDFFFRKFDCREVYPFVHLRTAEGLDLIPDFIVTNRVLQKALVVDLKLPTAKVIVHEDNRVRFSQAVMAAREQLATYRAWFEESANRQRLLSRLGMEVYQPRLAVVIGRTSDLFVSERQRLTHNTSDIDVVTYDDMLVFAEQQAAYLRDIWRSRRPQRGGQSWLGQK